MPLNYSKWDQLEVSDDSDIEGHPNVDHKSLVRMKQRTIHQKRAERNQKIATLEAQIACNNVLLPRIIEIANYLSSRKDSEPATVYFNNLISKLQANPSKDCPPGNDPNKPEQTYDGMLLSLLTMVTEKAKWTVQEAGIVSDAEKQERLDKELQDEMKMHVKQLMETIERDQKQLVEEEAEKKKKITSDDLHEGFDSKYVPPKPEPAPVPVKPVSENKGKGKEKEKVSTVEVLNPKGVEAAQSKDIQSSSVKDEEEEEGLPEMTPSLVEFSKIRLWEFEKSFEFIKQHRDVYVPGAPDALFIAAFKAQTDGKKTYAKQCIHQSLLLQYCEKLGKDGVGVFFKKMISSDKRALTVFKDDVERTYQHVVNRVKLNSQEQSQREQIQLVPENPDTTISFNVPDGPPPENLVLEGPGTEDLDIEEVRKALQFRWNVFEGYSLELKEALTNGGLEGVNKVLGDMDVAEAEAVVQSLDATGILNFAGGGIRDETGKEKENVA